VMLVAAAWIAVAAKDRDVVLLPPTEAERIAAEHNALLLAARVRLRTAQDARDQAPWYRAWVAERAVREAEAELSQVEAAAPPPAQHPSRVTAPSAAVSPNGKPPKPEKRKKASKAAGGPSDGGPPAGGPTASGPTAGGPTAGGPTAGV
jgi:membrane protein